MTLLHRMLAAGVAGLTLDLAFPGLGWWPLASLALAALYLLLAEERTGRAALLGLAFGLAFFVPHLAWSGIYVGPMPWLALALLEALYIAGFALAVSWARRCGVRGDWLMLLCAPLWVAQEAVRSRTPFGGFPWGRLAFSQADSPMAGWAWLGGAPAVSLAVALTAGLIAVAARAAVKAGLRREDARAKWLRAGVAVCLAVAPFWAAAALGTGDTSASRTLSVAAVQGNVARSGLDFNAERREVLGNHVDGTLRLAQDVAAGKRSRPDLVLWPENSSDIDPTRDREAAQAITGAARAIGAPVVVGAVLAEPAPRVSNAALIWSPEGRVSNRYVKRRPVPFAEYVPYRDFFRTLTSKVDLVRADFAPGDGPPVLDAGSALLGVAICFEVAFDDQLRDAVRQGAGLLLVPTNNATFGRTDESVQQLAMSKLRAIELGRSVVHISTVGVSALIRPDGTVVDQGGHFTPEVLTASLPLRTGLTPAARAGVMPEWLTALVGLLVPLITVAVRRHRSGLLPTRRGHPGAPTPSRRAAPAPRSTRRIQAPVARR